MPTIHNMETLNIFKCVKYNKPIKLMEEERESGDKTYYFVYKKYFFFVRCGDGDDFGIYEKNKFSSKKEAETALINIKERVRREQKYKNIISRKIVDLEEKKM